MLASMRTRSSCLVWVSNQYEDKAVEPFVDPNASSSKPGGWDRAAVCAWAKNLGLEEAARLLEANDVDGKVRITKDMRRRLSVILLQILVSLNEEDLIEMGLDCPKIRSRLLNSIPEGLRQKQDS